jgi:hypothetical protein
MAKKDNANRDFVKGGAVRVAHRAAVEDDVSASMSRCRDVCVRACAESFPVAGHGGHVNVRHRLDAGALPTHVIPTEGGR